MAMMDELVQQISQRTGIPQDKAQLAAHAAIEFLGATGRVLRRVAPTD